MSAPCKDAADTNVPKFQANAHILATVTGFRVPDIDDYWVVDEHGLYVGIARQRSILNPPRLNMILVDHNQPRQSIAALEEAELLEILDHHRLGNPYTHQPICFTVDVVGIDFDSRHRTNSRSGIVCPARHCRCASFWLLSDTLILTSPTTTERDRAAAERLARWAFVGGSPLRRDGRIVWQTPP